MPDDDLLIRIKTLADNYGLKQVQAELDTLKGATHEATKAAHEHAHGFAHAETAGRAFHHLLHEVTKESPILGEALRLALNPTTGLILGGVLAMEFFKRRAEEARKAAAEWAKETSEGFIKSAESADKLKTAAVEAEQAFTQQMKGLADAQSSASEKTKELIASIEREKAALLELSKIRGEPATAQTSIEAAAAAKEFMARRRGVEQAELAQPGLEAAVVTARGAATAGTAKLTDDLQRREADIERLKKQLEEAEKKLTHADTSNAAKVLAATKERDIARNALQDSLAIKSRDEQEIARLKRELAEAEKKALENQKLILEGRAALPGLEAGVRLRSAAQTLQTPTGTTVAVGAAALQHLAQFGGDQSKLSPQEQQAIKSLSDMLSANRILNPTILGLLRQNADDATWLAREVRAIEAYASRNKSQVKSTLVPP
jgi:hypothetical protein